MRSTLALCNFLLGCATAVQAPTVAVTPFGGPWSEQDVADVMEGARAWESLGFELILDPMEQSVIPLCPGDWHVAGPYDCRLRVGVRQVPDSDLPPGTAAYADRATDVISIGDRFHGRYLVHLAAHEVGHIILDTGEHLGPNTPGVMGQGNDLIELTDADLDLACRSIHLCL